MSTFPEVQSFPGWVEENRKYFKPPVGAKLMHGAGQMKIMVVGGPNERKDYHIEEGEEFFYMHQGNMTLEIIERGKRKSVRILEGQMFMLPARIPHSPQREAGTVGLVFERERADGELDGMRWYVDGSTEILYEDWFHCINLGSQLGPVIKAFKESDACKTGRPTREYTDSKVEIDSETVVADPVDFKEWAAARAGTNVPLFDGEFKCAIMQAPAQWPHWQYHEGETLLWQHSGEATVTMRSGDDTKVAPMGAGDMLLIPRGMHFKVQRPPGGCGMVASNRVVALPSTFPVRSAGEDKGASYMTKALEEEEAAKSGGSGAGGAGAGSGSSA